MLIDFFLFGNTPKLFVLCTVQNLLHWHDQKPKMQKHFFSSLTSVLYSYNAHFHHKVQTFAFSAEPEHRHTVWSLKGQNTQQAKGDYVDAVLDLKGLFPAGTGVLIFN